MKKSLAMLFLSVNRCKGVFIYVMIASFLLTASCSDDSETKHVQITQGYVATKEVVNPVLPDYCPSGSMLINKKSNIFSDEFYALRNEPARNAKKKINHKASEVTKRTEYLNVDSSVTVIEECRYKEWSFVRVVEPYWLKDTHFGWVESKILANSRSKDKYAQAIPDYVLEPYTKASYPKTYEKYKDRLECIEELRLNAAKMAVDLEGCKRISDCQLSDSTTTAQSIGIFVDCQDGRRFKYNEENIQAYIDKK